VYVRVWLGLLIIVGLEVALTYAKPHPAMLVNGLLLLALLEVSLGLWYFMHLRFEKRLLLWSLVLFLVIMIMMNQIWPDALRLRSLHR
jgi:heme/copper-type cytochrome/quinol oxidase subunit 4